MKSLRLTSCLLASVLLTASAHAQTNDWQAVEYLPQGMAISVTIDTPRHFVTHCTLQQVTDELLSCEAHAGRFASSPMTFQRATIQQVRMDHRVSSMAIGAVAGGTALAITAGVTSKASGRGALVVLGGLAGGFVGSFAGLIFHPAPLNFNGPVVYQR